MESITKPINNVGFAFARIVQKMGFFKFVLKNHPTPVLSNSLFFFLHPILVLVLYVRVEYMRLIQNLDLDISFCFISSKSTSARSW